MTNLLAQAFTQRTISQTIFREDFSRFADDAAFLAVWVEGSGGGATMTWTLDNTHVVDGESMSAHVHVVGTANPGDAYRVGHTVSDLTSGKAYTFKRQVWADEVVAGLPANQWNTITTTVTADGDGEVNLGLSFTTPSGGTFDTLIWFGDVHLIDPSFPVSEYYRTAFLFEGDTFLGVSRDGLKFDPEVERRNIPWDNKWCDVEQADWDTRVETVITGRFVQANRASQFQPGTSTIPGSGVTERLSARESGLFYTPGNYLTNLRMVAPSLVEGGGYLQVRFPSAICVQYAYASLSQEETEVSATFAARMPLDDAASSHVEAKPYVVELLEAFS